MMPMNLPRSNRLQALNRQRGVVLIVALVVLLVLSMLGISSMQGTLMEERMAGNMYDRNLAFQAAEAALRAGEADALAGTNIAYDVSSVSTTAPVDLEYDANWPGTAVDYSATLAGLATAPEYIIERQRPLPPLEADQPMQPPLMRVSARGTGRNGTSVVVLQSIYKP
jgi:type IV pilus assembly protein PilX